MASQPRRGREAERYAVQTLFLGNQVFNLIYSGFTKWTRARLVLMVRLGR